MTRPKGSIALISPIKDELENIDKYLSSIEYQTVPIKLLVILENDSTDGSAEYLDQIKSVKNVEVFKVIHISFEDKTYRVGKKYATIISEGLKWLKKQSHYDELDYIGILDGDVFPEKRYYEKLTCFLNQNAGVGITSGIIYTHEGNEHIADSNFVRGGCRLWRKKCLEESGYLIAYTADTVSMALAHLKGWKTQTVKTAHVISREVNVRIANSRNKGYHAYYRGHTLFYVSLKTIYLVFVKGRLRMGYEFFIGYLDSMLRRRDRIDQPQVRTYFRNYLINKFLNKYE